MYAADMLALGVDKDLLAARFKMTPELLYEWIEDNGVDIKDLEANVDVARRTARDKRQQLGTAAFAAKRGMLVADIAELCDVSRQAVYYWIQGGKIPRPDKQLFKQAVVEKNQWLVRKADKAFEDGMPLAEIVSRYGRRPTQIKGLNKRVDLDTTFEVLRRCGSKEGYEAIAKQRPDIYRVSTLTLLFGSFSAAKSVACRQPVTYRVDRYSPEDLWSALADFVAASDKHTTREYAKWAKANGRPCRSLIARLGKPWKVLINEASRMGVAVPHGAM